MSRTAAMIKTTIHAVYKRATSPSLGNNVGEADLLGREPGNSPVNALECRGRSWFGYIRSVILCGTVLWPIEAGRGDPCD